MGKSMLILLQGLGLFLLVLLLMIFAGLNWQTVVEVSFVFGPPVTLRLVLLLLSTVVLGFLLSMLVFANVWHSRRQHQQRHKDRQLIKKLDPKHRRWWCRSKKRNNEDSASEGEKGQD